MNKKKILIIVLILLVIIIIGLIVRETVIHNDGKIDKSNPMTREECKNECNAALRKVLGDERYIQYLENAPAKRLNCEMRKGPQNIRGCHNGHVRCPQGGEKVCPRK